MAQQIKFGDKLVLKGETLILDNGTVNDSVIKSNSGTLQVDDNLTVSGNLIVSGNATTINSLITEFADSHIVLNGASPFVNQPAGIEINLGGAPADNKKLSWDNTDTKWTIGTETFKAGSFEGNLTGNTSGVHTGNVIGNVTGDVTGSITGALTGTVSSIANHTTSDLAEGTNLYYTDARVSTHLNTSTATTNQVLAWTGTDYSWITTGAHFDGAYSSLTGAPTLPTAVSQLTNDSGFISSVPPQTFASIVSTPTTLAGYGITDATDTDTDTTYTAGSGLTLTGTVLSLTDAHFSGLYTDLTSMPTTLAGYGITDATDTTYTVGTGLTLTGTVLSLTDAHFSGSYTDLTSKPTIPTIIGDLTNVQNATPSEGHVLTWSVSASAWVPANGIRNSYTTDLSEGSTNLYYTDARADARAQLKIDALVGGATATHDTLVEIQNLMATDAELSSAIAGLNHNALSGFVSNQHINWTTDQGSTNIHASNYTNTDTNTTYTAGSGLSLTGTAFANTSPDQTVVLTGTGATSITGTYPNFTITSTDTNTNTDTNTTYTAGSGLSLTGTAFANTSPDQTVALTGTGGTSISGTYPNFSIYSSDTDTTYTAGNGITISSGQQGEEIINSAPDQVVSLSGTGATSITGTYPNFTITSTDTNTTTDATKLPLTGGDLSGNTKHVDGVKAFFGTSADLSIYHDGADSYIKDAGIGNLKIHSNETEFNNVAGTIPSAKFNSGGAVSLYYDGAIKFATTTTGMDVTGNIVPVTDDTYDLGSSTKKYANVYGHSIEATFADLAERYATDVPYEVGTVVTFGGEAEITVTSIAGDVSVAGVISTNPAIKLNADAGNSQTHPYVALRGRVPCMLVGPVSKGDLIVTADNEPGYAQSIGKNDAGHSVFAKSITTDLSVGKKVIEVVIL